MACFKPIEGWRRADGAVTFSLKSAGFHTSVRSTVPCGRCIGCRLAKAASWGGRILAELESWPTESSFVTFTYDDDHLPDGGNLRERDMQLFFKSFRKFLGSWPLRYFYAGEYGSKTRRPHYHAILFGYMPDDLVLYKRTSHGPLFLSHELESKWKLGQVVVGRVMFESAAYVASYTLDKLHGDRADAVYGNGWVPEFARMSRRPGIGLGYAFDNVERLSFRDQLGIAPGRHIPIPRYMLEVLKGINPVAYDELKVRRRLAGASSPDNTPARLRVREQVILSRISAYHRSLGE